jgi:NADPH:quinone reductase
MKVVRLEEFGGPEVLVAADASDPVPGPGQALIEVSFANITFVETMIRASGFGPFETELPMIPGIGGVVASAWRPTNDWRFGRRRRRIRFRAARPW